MDIPTHIAVIVYAFAFLNVTAWQDAADIITAIRQGRCDLSPYWSSSVQAKQHAAILRDPYKLFAYLVTNSGLRLKLKADTTPRPLSPDLSIELPAALYENVRACTRVCV